MANVNILIPEKPPTGSSANTIALFQAALAAQAAFNTAAAAYQNGVLADQTAAAAATTGN